MLNLELQQSVFALLVLVLFCLVPFCPVIPPFWNGDVCPMCILNVINFLFDFQRDLQAKSLSSGSGKTLNVDISAMLELLTSATLRDELSVFCLQSCVWVVRKPQVDGMV